eukprot:1059385-Prymnesium_polylepis.2
MRSRAEKGRRRLTKLSTVPLDAAGRSGPHHEATATSVSKLTVIKAPALQRSAHTRKPFLVACALLRPSGQSVGSGPAHAHVATNATRSASASLRARLQHIFVPRELRDMIVSRARHCRGGTARTRKQGVMETCYAHLVSGFHHPLSQSTGFDVFSHRTTT